MWTATSLLFLTIDLVLSLIVERRPTTAKAAFPETPNLNLDAPSQGAFAEKHGGARKTRKSKKT